MDIDNAKQAPPEVPTRQMIDRIHDDLIQRKEVITDRINSAEAELEALRNEMSVVMCALGEGVENAMPKKTMGSIEKNKY